MLQCICSLALGFDEGSCIIKVGREEPVASMDGSGKIIWARHNEIQTVNVKSLGADQEVGPLIISMLGRVIMFGAEASCKLASRLVSASQESSFRAKDACSAQGLQSLLHKQ